MSEKKSEKYPYWGSIFFHVTLGEKKMPANLSSLELKVRIEEKMF